MAIYKGSQQLSGSGGAGGHTIQDDGVDESTRSRLNFKSPLTVTDNESADSTDVDITLTSSDIPNLDVAKITTGTFGDSFIPNLNASKINAGTFDAEDRINSSPNGTDATDGHVLTADGDGGVSWEATTGSYLPSKPANPDEDTEYNLKITSGGVTSWVADTGGGGGGDGIASEGTWTPTFANLNDSETSSLNSSVTAGYIKVGSYVKIFLYGGEGNSVSGSWTSRKFQLQTSSFPFAPIEIGGSYRFWDGRIRNVDGTSNPSNGILYVSNGQTYWEVFSGNTSYYSLFGSTDETYITVEYHTAE